MIVRRLGIALAGGLCWASIFLVDRSSLSRAHLILFIVLFAGVCAWAITEAVCFAGESLFRAGVQSSDPDPDPVLPPPRCHYRLRLSVRYSVADGERAAEGKPVAGVDPPVDGEIALGEFPLGLNEEEAEFLFQEVIPGYIRNFKECFDSCCELIKQHYPEAVLGVARPKDAEPPESTSPYPQDSTVDLITIGPAHWNEATGKFQDADAIKIEARFYKIRREHPEWIEELRRLKVDGGSTGHGPEPVVSPSDIAADPAGFDAPYRSVNPNLSTKLDLPATGPSRSVFIDDQTLRDAREFGKMLNEYFDREMQQWREGGIDLAPTEKVPGPPAGISDRQSGNIGLELNPGDHNAVRAILEIAEEEGADFVKLWDWVYLAPASLAPTLEPIIDEYRGVIIPAARLGDYLIRQIGSRLMSDGPWSIDASPLGLREPRGPRIMTED